MSRITASIYALIDPRTREVRYIGKSNDPEGRFIQHFYDMGDSPKARWIQGLRRDNLVPRLFILESKIRLERAHGKEKRWIEHALEKGYPLLNSFKGPKWRRARALLAEARP